MAQATGFESDSRSWREIELSSVQQQPRVSAKPAAAAAAATTDRRQYVLPRRPGTGEQQFYESELATPAAAVSAAVFGNPQSGEWCVRSSWLAEHDNDGERVAVSSVAGPMAKLQHVHGRHGTLAEWHRQQKRYNR